MQPSAQISLNGQGLDHSNANSVEESDYTIAWDGFLYDADGTPHHAAARCVRAVRLSARRRGPIWRGLIWRRRAERLAALRRRFDAALVG